ncbi:MAG: flagellar hook-associated protein FlgL [Firmicutes bacterium]|nr:flagellar hook-associated protein FlgL [Bacillota bacterium]
MRVTNNMIHRGLTGNIQSAMKRMNKNYNRLSTGKMISRPSDDPVGMIIGMRLKDGIAAGERYHKNAETARALLNSADYALDGVTSVLHRLTELATKAANGTMDQTALEAVKNEVLSMRNHLYQIANTQHENTFIFAGQRTNQPAYSLVAAADPDDPEEVQWDGSDEPLVAEVGTGIRMEVSVPGHRVFGDPSHDFFAELTEFIEHLENGDFQAISDTVLPAIHNRLNEVLKVRGEIGAKVNRLESNIARMEIMNVNFRELLSKTEDVDYAEVTMNLMMQESVYQAALAVGARISQNTLVNYL